jgi:hypothetical protein
VFLVEQSASQTESFRLFLAESFQRCPFLLCFDGVETVAHVDMLTDSLSHQLCHPCVDGDGFADQLYHSVVYVFLPIPQLLFLFVV